MELSQTYVMKWADAESTEKSLPEYVRNARALMDREMKRVELFSLPNTTKRELLTLLEDHLIQRKEPKLSTFPTYHAQPPCSANGRQSTRMSLLISSRQMQ